MGQIRGSSTAVRERVTADTNGEQSMGCCLNTGKLLAYKENVEISGLVINRKENSWASQHIRDLDEKNIGCINYLRCESLSG